MFLHTTIALLSVTVCIALLIRVVIPPVAFLVLIILIFIHFLFMNHKVRNLRLKTPHLSEKLFFFFFIYK